MKHWSLILFLLTLPASAQELPAPTPRPAPPPVRGGTPSGQALTSPAEDESFRFVVYGDRTGGRPAGLGVLRAAIELTNDLDPAFVMTVGDLVNGYNRAPKWLEQMREYKGIMNQLRSPWYPVAGNHDVYARPAKPGGHTDLYKEHFGPLYYGFDYKWAHFVVLFSDEALDFHEPSQGQNLSPEQLAWLRADLAATRAEQVFVFLHHPRWLADYAGCNWDTVHEVLAADGRVQAVFAGHIHAYRDDGARDGVHYYTLATTGGNRHKRFPALSFDHLNLISVRRDRFASTVIPIGAAFGGDAVLGSETDAVAKLLTEKFVEVHAGAQQAVDSIAQSSFAVELSNPTDRAIQVALELDSPRGWVFSHPSLERIDLAPGVTKEIQIQARAEPLQAVLAAAPRLTARTTFSLQSGREQPLEVFRSVPVERVGLTEWARTRTGPNQALILDGKSAVRVDLPQGQKLEAFTLECWVRGQPPRGRQALVTKTERSSLGLFWSDRGRDLPSGSAFLSASRKYANVTAPRPWEWGRWTHVALVHDGRELRLFLGGEQVDSAAAPGPIEPNDHPLYVGADPDSESKPSSFFQGAIDDVRLSRVARYREAFTPPRTLEPDAETLFLFSFDDRIGSLFPDLSERGHHGTAVGSPRLAPARSWN